MRLLNLLRKHANVTCVDNQRGVYLPPAVYSHLPFVVT